VDAKLDPGSVFRLFLIMRRLHAY